MRHKKNITELSGQVVGLQDILSNKQARGAFGNVQLRDLVRNALPPSAYQFEATLSNGRRADCVIKLPMPPGPIAVDAKFPLEGFEALRAAADEQQKNQAASTFRRDILKHIKDISERYIVPEETAESALMFLPSEAIYAELHANFPDLVQQSYRARVWIVSPTTLMATLNTVRAVLQDANMREQAAVIQSEVRKMLEDVSRLGERVGRLQRHFKQASEDVDQIFTSTNKIGRRGQMIVDIELGEKLGEKLGEDLTEGKRSTTTSPNYRSRLRRVANPFATGERRRERAVVEIVELAANRNTVSQTRHHDRTLFERIRDVVGGGLSIDRCVGREDNLADFGSAGPRNEGGDAQIVGTDAVQSGQGAAEDVIPTLIGLGTFQRPQIRDFFDDAQQAAVAPRVLADRTGFDGIDIAAIGADRDVRGGSHAARWRVA